MTSTSTNGAYVNRKAFFSPEVFAEERERIFRHTWQFVAHETEIPSPGDYVQRKLGTDTVIVTRSEKGEFKVMLNSCSHRGAQLCTADMGNTSHFRCSYHGWTYNNSGDLRGVPQMPALYGKMDRSSRGLVQARVATFYGLIFANWDHSGPSLDDYLGDMKWHMKLMFDRDFEVLGPPTRLLGHHNWKSGAENWLADGYHGEMTHKVIIDMGVVLQPGVLMPYLASQGAGMPTPDESMGDLNDFYVTTDQGHSSMAYRLPLKFERSPVIGYETHLWDDFASRMDSEELECARNRVATVATIFPNFSYADLTMGTLGDDTPPISLFIARVWIPVAADRTELFNLVLVPKGASEEWKRQAEIAFARNLGSGGVFEVDDLQNWTGMADANAGAVAQSISHDYTALPDVTPVDKPEWPGNIYAGPVHDVQFRNYYNAWSRWMTDSSDVVTGIDEEAIAVPDSQTTV
ncbi:Rieske 2Fe-2S domain-containing protein [Rhodococcus sp. NPDC127530]|uniref:aromatic ring-hydroxylating oxygenase subunit alpha n=1 Tax=unclassified Rhodococcus (in: high G+C Gram-positive bacteria) TaxID=192944 RepID=UPI003641B0FE